VDGNLVSRPGPRIVEGLEALARLIHPDRFPATTFPSPPRGHMR
jgi:iron complex transport system substrate-binding protein